MLVKLIKIKELGDAKHPNNIDVGFIKIGKFISKPIVGKSFFVGFSFVTSTVTEIIDDKTFKTLNSVYQYEVIDKLTDKYGEN